MVTSFFFFVTKREKRNKIKHVKAKALSAPRIFQGGKQVKKQNIESYCEARKQKNQKKKQRNTLIGVDKKAHSRPLKKHHR